MGIRDYCEQMINRLRSAAVVATVVAAATLVPSLTAQAASVIRITSTSTTSITQAMPFLRLRFTSRVRVASLPRLVTSPSLATSWQQIGSHDVQAVVSGTLSPSIQYVVEVPSAMSCSTRCTFTQFHSISTLASADVRWEDQLLAELHYLPLTFTASSVNADRSQPSGGPFTWAYPNLPSRLSALWRTGSDNVIVTGALMAFQANQNLPFTGVLDPATWNHLLRAVKNGQVNPSSYNYVDVRTASHETLTLFVAGRPVFHALVNTGISVAPTSLSTHPVYLRYTTTTMSGTNPDGTHYNDPGIPWVSYFYGGEALHGFIRSTYGWPQSLGCVEMPFASAKRVFPYTPIGTLVTVH